MVVASSPQSLSDKSRKSPTGHWIKHVNGSGEIQIIKFLCFLSGKLKEKS